MAAAPVSRTNAMLKRDESPRMVMSYRRMDVCHPLAGKAGAHRLACARPEFTPPRTHVLKMVPIDGILLPKVAQGSRSSGGSGCMQSDDLLRRAVCLYAPTPEVLFLDDNCS